MDLNGEIRRICAFLIEMPAHVFEPAPVFQQLASGIAGSEGPMVTNDGRIFLVEPSQGAILEIDPKGERKIVAHTGGMPAGLQLSKDGTIWVADMRHGILKLSPLGDVEKVVSSFGGRPIRGCNDCYFDSKGNLYFTAPAGSSADQSCGEIYCRLVDGTVVQLDQGYAFCNGIAVSADDRLLIVAETFTKKLFAYRLSAPGKVAEKYLFAILPGEHHGGPDGLEFDARGNLIATNWGGGHLEVFSPDGAPKYRVALPFSKPSNLHFTGPASTTLLVTEHTFNGLWKCEWPCPGQQQYGWS